MNKPELLLPAGNLENLITAIRYGADAVYLGGQRFGLRAKADNFTTEEMREGVSYAHAHGAKVYLTVNIFAHNRDIEGLKEYFRELKGIPFDALLISDPGVFLMSRELLPEIPVHISTQANNTNYLTWKFWKEQGAERVVAARELSLEEIREIHDRLHKEALDSGGTEKEMEIEAFVHGAMCISYSGRCLLSSYFTGRDANQGSCTHPCRWKYELNYAIEEESRPGEYLPVEEDERGTYILNSKDLCMVGHIPELLNAGVCSLKIEGRMKTSLYVAVTASVYRRAIDEYLRDEELYRRNLPDYLREIGMCTTREFTTGFYFRKPDAEDQIYSGSTYRQNAIYIGMVEAVDEEGAVHFTQKNKFSVGDEIQVMPFRGDPFPVRVERIRNEEGEEQESAPHPKQYLRASFSFPAGKPAEILPGMLLRQIREGAE